MSLNFVSRVVRGASPCAVLPYRVVCGAAVGATDWLRTATAAFVTRLIPTIATSHSNPAMEQKTKKYRVGHYAVQNREEVGAAIFKNASKVKMEEFANILDIYDEARGPQPISPPVEMIQELVKIDREEKKGETTQEKMKRSQSACCDLLNGLIGLLPSM